VPGRAPPLRPRPARPGDGSPPQGVEYAKQLREKQKIKRIYGLSEKQFRNTFERVSTQQGITGHNLLAALETRLDNVVYRMGFAPSRKAARQLIRHRHVEVKGHRVDIPSYQVRPGEEIRVKQASREIPAVVDSMDQSQRGAPLSWIAVDKESFSGGCWSARSARASRSPRRSSSSSSSTASKRSGSVGDAVRGHLVRAPRRVRDGRSGPSPPNEPAAREGRGRASLTRRHRASETNRILRIHGYH
jgi:small subunit ribosomal protein S4